MGRKLLRDEIPVGICKVRATFSWSGESPQDLGFVEGDIIEVLNNGDGDWWTGKLKRNKQVGIFPRNFAEYVDPEQKTMSAALMKKEPQRRKILGDYQLETPMIDFSTVSLSDLAISDPQLGEEPSLVPKKSSTAVDSHTKGHGAVSNLDPGLPVDLGLSPALSGNVNFTESQSSAQSRSSQFMGSVRSTKSAQEILEDIGNEMNLQYLDDFDFGAKDEGLSFDAPLTSPNFSMLSETDTPPQPPPHRSLRSSTNSNALYLFGENQDSYQTLTKQHGQSRSLVPTDLTSSFTRPELNHGSKPELGFGNGIRDHTTMSNTDLRSANLGNANPRSSGLETPPPAEPSTATSLGVNNEDPLARLDVSPLLDKEIPFDPKAFKPASSIGDHIGSHIDYGYTSTQPNIIENLRVNDENTVPTGESEPKVAIASASSALTGPSITNRTSFRGARLTKKPSKAAVYKNSQEPASTSTYIKPKEPKLNFFQRLLPMNSQNLRRRSSRASMKSSTSGKSANPIKQTLRTMKSKFSFMSDSEPDADAYQATTQAVISKPAPPIAGKPPLTSTSLMSSIASENYRSAYSAKFTYSAKSTSSVIDSGKSAPLASLTKNAALSNTSANNKAVVGGRWIETRRDLYRAQSLTERDTKKRRQELELQGINCDDIVERLNSHTEGEFHDYRLESFEDVDQAVLTMSTWPQLMTPSVFASSRIGRHFKDPVERARAVFLLCSTRIEHVDHTSVHNNVMQSRQATAEELAQTVFAMCTALGIECEVIEGHVRHIVRSDSAHITSSPHWWNAVKINEEWRLLDARTAATADEHTCSLVDPEKSHLDSESDDTVNLFYFLTPPTQLLFSHVPTNHHKQFLEPPITTATAAMLPLGSPAAFAHGVYFNHFWLGATRLADLEVSELHLNVPNAQEDLVAFVDGKPALSQAFYENRNGTVERLFKIKSFVPPKCRQALLQVYAVAKDQPNRERDYLELLWSVELRHVNGMEHNTPFDFVIRHAVPNLAEHDLNVLEPQCYRLTGGDTYTFRVDNFSRIIDDAPFLKHLKQPQIAVQSPSGRLTRLVPKGTNVNDTFRASVKTLEVGTWRAVARQNGASGWAPFAEWFCS